MKNGKRIVRVVLSRQADTDPDTSYLGEYSSKREGQWTIDRDHATDCASQEYNHPTETIDKLERILRYVNGQRNLTEDVPANGWIFDALSDAEDLIEQAQEELTECDCDGRGDRERGEYRFFNPNWENYAGADAAEIRRCCLQDYERMERLQRGDWGYLGIQAEAEVVVEGVYQTIHSGGLWGVESDSGEDYLREVEGEELTQLRDQLRALGFGTRAVGKAMKEVERKGE